jgi:glutamyl-tRNA synthetase
MKMVILKYALQNAVFYKGKAYPQAVLGKVLAENPELRRKTVELRKYIEEVVKQVNSLSLEEQKERLSEIDSSLMVKEEKKQESLPHLLHAEKGKVVTRFAPAPTGPLNLLHVLRAVMLSYVYAEKYEGKFILRFEDTDPSKVEASFYDMIKEDLKSLQVKWDKEFVESDYMKLFYTKADFLIKKGKAYICSCSAEEFRSYKNLKKDCSCRAISVDENLLRWKAMLEGRISEGGAVMRLKTSMREPNPVLRDPPLLRISEAPHPLKGREFRLWPLYNFANVVMDDFCGVTHVFRGKEHEHNTAVQKAIYKALGAKLPDFLNFGMMYLPGEKMHTRDIKEGIERGAFSGWDDLKLPTVRSFLRRGFHPKAFKEFALLCGLSKTDIKIDIENFSAINRKIIDIDSERFMVVSDPVGIDISSALQASGLEKYVFVKKHPEKEGERKIKLTKKIFVSGDDYKRFKDRDVRLIDLFNIKLGKQAKLAKNQVFDLKTPKIQWVSQDNVDVRILREREEKAVGETALSELKEGDVIQMLRIGFGRVDSKGKEIAIAFAHK